MVGNRDNRRPKSKSRNFKSTMIVHRAEHTVRTSLANSLDNRARFSIGLFESTWHETGYHSMKCVMSDISSLAFLVYGSLRFNFEVSHNIVWPLALYDFVCDTAMCAQQTRRYQPTPAVHLPTTRHPSVAATRQTKRPLIYLFTDAL